MLLDALVSSKQAKRGPRKTGGTAAEIPLPWAP